MTAGHPGLLLGASALCLSLFSPGQALARSPAFAATLEYRALPSCPTAAALAAIVEARLGYEPFEDGAPSHVVLSITTDGAALNGRIEWHDARGQWTGDQSFSMRNGDCLRLARTMGLALAVQIQLLSDRNTAPAVDREPASDGKPFVVDGEGVPDTKTPTVHGRVPAGEPQPKDAARNAEQPNANSLQTRDSPQPIRRPQRSAPASFAIGVGPAIGFGIAPKPALIGRAFTTLTWSHTSVELAAEASLPATARRSDGAGVSVQFRLLSAAGCRDVERWQACLVVNGGQVNMAGQDIDQPASTHLPFLAAGARATFSQPLGTRAFVRVHANALTILTRWTASLDDVPVWTMPRFALTLGLDAGVQLF